MAPRVRNLKHFCARWLTATVDACMFVTTNHRVSDSEPLGVPMNRAVTRFGNDGAITQLLARLQGDRDPQHRRQDPHVPRAVGVRRYRDPRRAGSKWEILAHRPVPHVREQSRGSQPRSRRTDRAWRTKGSDVGAKHKKRADRTDPQGHLSADPHITTVTPRRHTDREVVSDHGRTALGALPISAERLTSDDAQLVVHRIHGQRRQHQPDTP